MIDEKNPRKNLLTTSETTTSASGPVSAFREKLATEEIKRFEMYVSSDMRDQIKKISKIEKLSSGVTAQALLKLGIEAYETHAKLPEASASKKLGQFEASVAKSDGASNFLSGNLSTTSNLLLRSQSSSLGRSVSPAPKGLSGYSERTQKSDVSRHAHVASNLIQAALKRGSYNDKNS